MANEPLKNAIKQGLKANNTEIVDSDILDVVEAIMKGDVTEDLGIDTPDEKEVTKIRKELSEKKKDDKKKIGKKGGKKPGKKMMKEDEDVIFKTEDELDMEELPDDELADELEADVEDVDLDNEEGEDLDADESDNLDIEAEDEDDEIDFDGEDLDEEIELTFDDEKNEIKIKDKEGEELDVKTDFKGDLPKEEDIEAEMDMDIEAAAKEEEEVKESFDAMIDKEQNLSEGFRNKLSVLFEMYAAAKAKKLTSEQTKKIVESLDVYAEQQVAKFKKEQQDKINHAITEAKKVQAYNKMKHIVESLFGADVSKDIKMSERYAKEIKALREENEKLKKSVARLNESVELAKMNALFESKTSKLSDDMKKNLSAILESIDFKSVEDFSKKLDTSIKYINLIGEQKKAIAKKEKRIVESFDAKKPSERSDSKRFASPEQIKAALEKIKVNESKDRSASEKIDGIDVDAIESYLKG